MFPISRDPIRSNKWVIVVVYFSGYKDGYQLLSFLAALIKVVVVHNKGAVGCNFFHLVYIYKNYMKM